MGINYILVSIFAIVLNSVESSKSPKNDWMPSFPENTEFLNDDELESLLKHLNPAETLDDEFFGHHTSMPPDTGKHTHQDHQFASASHSSGPHFGSPAHGDPIPQIPHDTASSSSSRTLDSPERSHSFAASLLRARSRSPSRPNSPISGAMNSSIRLPSPDGMGCGFENFRTIRLIPYRNPQQIFELRRYTFPVLKRLKILIKNSQYGPTPTDEQIVISTRDGDVFAILESHKVLAGFYIYDIISNSYKRAKINITSGRVTKLTRAEYFEIPVGRQRLMKWHFDVIFSNSHH